LSKPGSDAFRCMQDHNQAWTPRRQTQVRVVIALFKSRGSCAGDYVLS